MTKTIEAKPVREARAAARRMARKTEFTYQQALDKVARDAGAEHWAAFAAMHPSVQREIGRDEDNAVQHKTQKRRDTMSGYVRALVSGEHGANEDRIRSTMVISEAESFAVDLPADEDGMIEIDQDRVRRNMWWGVAKNAATPPLSVGFIGAVYAIGNTVMPDAFSIGFKDVAVMMAWAAGISLAIFLVCLAIGDQPGMERRRATAWTLMLWAQIIGAAAFFLNGFGAFDDAVQRLTGIAPETGFVLGMGAVIIGSEIRGALHALMALGAALGPKGEGSSFADLDAMMSASEAEREEERLERKRTAPPHVPMTPEMARELGSRKSGKGFGLVGNVLVGMVALGCLLSFVGVVAQLGFGVDARPIGYAALAFLGPLVLIIMAGTVAFFIGCLINLPGRWRKEMHRHRLVRQHEQVRRI